LPLVSEPPEPAAAFGAEDWRGGWRCRAPATVSGPRQWCPVSRGLDGELRRRAAAHTAILYAFDLIEHDGGDLRNLPFLDRKAALAQLLRHTKAGILLNEHVAEDGAAVFAHACRLGAEGIVSKKIDGAYLSGPCHVRIKVRNPASIAVQRERSEIWSRRVLGSARRR
jgi:bifunctional non-homologous end joining protein LigD